MNKVCARDRKNTNRFQISIEIVSPKILNLNSERGNQELRFGSI